MSDAIKSAPIAASTGDMRSFDHDEDGDDRVTTEDKASNQLLDRTSEETQERVLRAFQSILSEKSAHERQEETSQPEFFTDLNLDQAIASIIAGYETYDLSPFYYGQLETIEEVNYRQEIFRELENPVLFGYITSFSERMRDMRAQLAQAAELRLRYQRVAWLRDAIETYCAAVTALTDQLAQTDLHSRGLVAFRTYLARYGESASFITLAQEAERVKGLLSTVRYCVHLKGLHVRVFKYDTEADYSAEVLETFDRFKQGATKDYRIGFRNSAEVNHVESQILEIVAQLFSDVFLALDEFGRHHRDFLDGAVRAFDREIQFYVAYIEHIAKLKTAELQFCEAEVSRESKEVFATETFDLALANKLVLAGQSVVTNDFFMKDPERILVVSGPNQGGKTTFARTFGQLHFLANLGCPIPGRRAQLFHHDQMFTHFGKEEELTRFSGKLEDDLVRIREILIRATTNSIVVVNEIFASTTAQDALFLGTKVLEKISELDLLCVYVTFVDELVSLSEKTVSMVSTIVPEHPTERTYKVVRRPADGLAYAIAIAEKYRLTYDRLKARITS